ncbi:hypothetical protein RJI07_04110 [Mycoplasmatota bacterium WC30]
MNTGQVLYFLFIGSHTTLKIFLGACLVVLGVYIFFLEGRIVLIKLKIRKLLKRDKGQDGTDGSPEVELNVSYSEKKLKKLIILWSILTILSIVLMITY